jgi:hypothetical protein
MSLDRDRGPAYPLCGFTGLAYGQRSSDTFLTGVAQNSFPSFSEAHNRWNRCCVLAWVAALVVIVAGWS